MKTPAEQIEFLEFLRAVKSLSPRKRAAVFTFAFALAEIEARNADEVRESLSLFEKYPGAEHKPDVQP